MDYQKKKCLTQSVAFLQANLVLTAELLTSLKVNGVLTAEEASVVQKDETTSGKVLELVCLLKRKDNRTFSKFVEVLEDKGCRAVAAVLKTKGAAADTLKPDPRTIHLLETHLSGTSVNPRTIKDLGIGLVLKEIYTDDINALQDKLKRELRAKQTLPEVGASDSGSDRSTPPSKSPFPSGSSEVPKWDVPTQLQEMHALLKEKDGIIRHKDTEYAKLRNILQDTQDDLQGVLDLNSQYLTIISQLNQMQMHNTATPRTVENTQEAQDLEKKLEESRATIKKLEIDVIEISGELDGKESELEKALKRKKKKVPTATLR